MQPGDTSIRKENKSKSREEIVGKEILSLLIRYQKPLPVNFLSFSLNITTAEVNHFVRYLIKRGEVVVDLNGYIVKN